MQDIEDWKKDMEASTTLPPCENHTNERTAGVEDEDFDSEDLAQCAAYSWRYGDEPLPLKVFPAGFTLLCMF